MWMNATRPGDDRDTVKLAVRATGVFERNLDRLAALLSQWHEMQRAGMGRESHGLAADQAIRELPCTLARLMHKAETVIGQMHAITESRRLGPREVSAAGTDTTHAIDPHAGSRVFHLAHREAKRVDRLDLLLSAERHRVAHPSSGRKDYQAADAETEYARRLRESKQRRERDLGGLLDIKA